MSRAARASVACVIAMALTSAGTAAAGDDKVACARAGEKAQRLRADGKMIAARAELLVCARDACPAVIRSDCGQWLTEVEASTPTIVVRAKDGAGRDLRDVRVSIDGEVVATSLDGRAMPIDPGEHAVRYEHAARPAVDERVIIAAGEKNRLLSVTFASPAPPIPATTPARATTPEPVAAPKATTRSLGPSPAAWVFAGVSVAAIASFGYFGATGKSDLDDLRSRCAGHCPQGDVDRAWTRLVVADVSLGVAALTAGISTWLFLTPRRETVTEASIVPMPGGAALRWSARF